MRALLTPARAVRDSESRMLERLQKQNLILAELARERVHDRGDLSQTMRIVTEAAARTLDVDRASVWLYNNEQSLIRCADLYQRSAGTHSHGLSLPAADYPAYFRALQAQRIIAADDAPADPRTGEFSQSYLAPNGITSMLDAPIRLGSRMVGVVCHEHVGPARRWTLDEQNFARSMADHISLALETSERQRAEAELRLAREAAEAANRAKSEFLAAMSHEIRTPMNAVIGMAGLLIDTDLSPEQREFATIIRDSGDALLSILNDILDFSKIEAGQLELERQPFELRECVEAALDLLASRAAEKGLELAYLVDPRTPGTVVGDLTRLRQILVNLVSNGVKFTESGEVVVSVTSRELPEGRAELHFAVKDTGIGIPPERMDRLFRSFSQVDASTSRHYGGTGLGLAISRRLSELMGGSMGVESEVGRGSTFHFSVVVEAAAGPVRRYLHPEQPTLAGLRLLIVDDNAINRQVLSLQAQGWGMLVREAAHGAEALNALRSADEPFDLAILDIQMPGMDGVTLAQEIRRAPAGAGLPLVALSSLGRREAEAAGAAQRPPLFAAFLSKPIKASQLYNVLVGLLADQPHPEGARVTGVPAGTGFDATLGERLPLRILIVEDIAVNRKLLLTLLARFGYRADVAGNGVEALE
jgi:signal transduction histidine kinase/DNA-binding response OmpR family regulator